MPSRSRKKSKGQARKAKASAELQRWIASPSPNDSICNHGQANATPEVCVQFITSFFHTYNTIIKTTKLGKAAKISMKTAYNNFPEAVNNESNRDIVKKIFISIGVSSLLEPNKFHSQMARGWAAALMLIGSYTPSSPIPPGMFDERDASNFLRDADTLDGCKRSSVKFFINQIPCNCLDELYAQIKSTTPKMSHCYHCTNMKERSSIFICTGCERVMYCSELCQIANIPKHKQECKCWQNGRYTWDL